jgi:phospholipid transport system substrate-binding protein
MLALGVSRTRRFVLFVTPLLAAVSWGGTAALSQVSSLDAPSEFVRQLGERTIEVLSNESYSEADRMAHYRELLRDGFAVNTIGRFALGRHWRGATPELREEYIALFQDFVLDIYSKRLDGFSGENFVIIKSQTLDETDTLVSTEISGGDGPSIRVDYRVRSQQGKLQIVDVLVEGISLIVTQRSEFASVIRRDGLEGLLEKLRQYTNSN